MSSYMGQNKENIISFSLLYTKICKQSLSNLRWLFTCVFWTKIVIQGWSRLPYYIVVYSCCTLSCLIRYVLKGQLKWHFALAMHKGARYKTARVLSIYFHECSVWEQHLPWCAARVHFTSAASPVIPTPSWIPTTRILHRRAYRHRLLGIGYKPTTNTSKIH
jgi:hypothetical protein